MGGMDRPTTGRVFYRGKESTAFSDRELTFYRRWEVGFIFQLYNLMSSLTACENVELATELVQNPLPADQVLLALGLGDRMDHFPSQLSGGEQQRVAIARALPKTTRLYQFEDEAGNIVTLPAKGIFLSQGFANSIGVSAGDVVELSSYVIGGQTHPVPVKAVVKQYLGSGLYMSLEQLERLTRQKDTFSGVVLNSSADIKDTFQGLANIESVYSRADLVATFAEYMGMIIGSASFVIFLGGLLGFAILYNTTAVSIAERKREFSSLRVMGFSQREVFQLITRENTIALVIGLIAGAPLGKTMLNGMMKSIFAGSAGEMFYFPTSITVSAYLLTAALVTGFMVLTLAAVRQKVR